MRDFIVRALFRALCDLVPRRRPGRHSAARLTPAPEPVIPVSPWSRPWTSPSKEEAAETCVHCGTSTLVPVPVGWERRADGSGGTLYACPAHMLEPGIAMGRSGDPARNRWIAGQVPPYRGAMSDHPEAPVPAFEPPYYVSVFTTVRAQDQDGYAETSARMEELVKSIPGYLGMESAQTPGGLGITVGYFRDAEALIEWRNDEEHRAAQKRGREQWYESYSLHIAKVERSSGFTRG